MSKAASRHTEHEIMQARLAVGPHLPYSHHHRDQEGKTAPKSGTERRKNGPQKRDRTKPSGLNTFSQRRSSLVVGHVPRITEVPHQSTSRTKANDFRIYHRTSKINY